MSPLATPTHPSARAHLAWLGAQSLVAIAAYAFVARGFLSDGAASGAALAFGALALISTGALAALPLAIALAVPVAFARREFVTFGLVPVVFALLTFFVEADHVIFRIYRVHVNGMVLNLLTTSGGGDSFTLGAGTWRSAALLIASAVAFHLGVSWLALRRLFRRGPSAVPRKVLRLAVPCLAAAVLLDKGIYAWADFDGRTDLRRVGGLVPLYRPVTLTTFLRETMGFSPSRAEGPAPASDGTLDYPRAPLEFPAGAPRPNVVIVAVEGLRWDMLDPSVMPFLSRWAATQISCERNFSGGNASRFGIFSLLYGVDATLWRRFSEERRSPALVDALARRGYAFRILSGTDLNYPEFRQTAFRNVTSAITDAWPGDRVDRDRRQTDAFDAFLDEGRRPFFVFNFYDASHQPYLFPAEDAVFKPVLPPDQLDYVKIAAGHSDQVALLFNRYRNSLHYVDREIERLVTGLEARGLMDDTLVFVCGDHGEEFGEGGYVGHNSAFDSWQVRTPMVIHVPGAAARRIERPTSHEDVVPTILGVLRVGNPESDYSQGTSLLAADGPERRVVASWSAAAVIGRDETVVFGTRASNLDVSVIGAGGEPRPGRETAHRADLERALRRMTDFERALQR